jgi:hypothetical protein
MDLKNFNLRADAENGFCLKIKNPRDGSDTDAEVTILGSDSKRYRKAYTEELRNSFQGGEADQDEINARIYGKCIVNWKGFNEDGKVLEFSTEKAIKLLTEHQWLCDQVGKAVDNRLNFSRPPKKN